MALVPLLQLTAFALGAVLTLTGAALLVVAFRHGQAGRGDTERRTFRRAVASLAAGSALFLTAMVLGAGAQPAGELPPAGASLGAMPA